MLTRFLALASVAPGMVCYCYFTGQNASTLEEVYGPWVSSSTEIAGSAEANFSSVVGHRWSEWEAPNWSGAIKPASVQDLQEVVSVFCFRSSVPVLIHGSSNWE